MHNENRMSARHGAQATAAGHTESRRSASCSRLQTELSQKLQEPTQRFSALRPFSLVA